jgi:signal transduction histidine kinase
VASLDETHQREKKQLQTIMDNIPAGLLVIGSDERIELCNPTLVELIAGSDGLILGRKLTDIFPQLPDIEHRQGCQIVVSGHAGNTLVLTFATTEIEIDQVRKHLYIVQDVTEKFELDQMKKDFVAMVSHDLRSPLSSLQFTLAMLESGTFGVLSEQGQKNLQSSNAEVARLMRLINSLLEYGRMESGQLEMKLSVVDSDAIAQVSIESVRQLANKKQISLEYTPTNVQVELDEDKIIQVLINLLSNSLKYSPRGSRVELRIEELPGEVCFSVIDNGRGIPEDFKRLVFEKYKQVQKDDSISGSGLGLAIAKLIVESHNGEIGVDSEEGRGSTFWFVLPLKALRLPDDSAAAAL